MNSHLQRIQIYHLQHFLLFLLLFCCFCGRGRQEIQFSTNEIVENIFLLTLELVLVLVAWFLDVFVCCFVLFNSDFGWNFVCYC